jgi:flavin reductase (DIM6/NTAB) family NADH-FMN oxidoreductase RutF
MVVPVPEETAAVAVLAKNEYISNPVAAAAVMPLSFEPPTMLFRSANNETIRFYYINNC